MEIDLIQNIVTAFIIIVLIVMSVLIYRRFKGIDPDPFEETQKEKYHCPYCSEEVTAERVYKPIYSLNLKSDLECPNCKSTLEISKVPFLAIKISLFSYILIFVYFTIISFIVDETLNNYTFSMFLLAGAVCFIVFTLVLLLANKKLKLEKHA